MENDFDADSRCLVSSPALPKAASSTSVGVSSCQTPSVFHSLPVAHEVRHALQRLLDSGVETVIDVSRLPLTPTDEATLRDLLGFGEVKAELNVIGRSSICETAISGVWWVEHYGTHGESLGRFIEITPIPAILKAQPQDMREALTRLTEHLSKDSRTHDDD
ncbi:MAG: hydrogenase expression/formation C-terminal domain-containing protein [Gammaproteobacteria bacterium]